MSASVKALVFDAYGTLFDVHSVAGLAERLAPGHGADLAKLWRQKQLEYTWLGSLMERRGDFAAVTAQALDYAVSALMLPVDDAARAQLVDAWLDLTPYPDAIATLRRLKSRPRWILSNGTRAMLDPLLARSGLREHLDGVLSVDEANVYKPSPRVYALAVDRLKLDPSQIGFVSANGWDAVGAKAFGFHVWWINRAGLPIDRHGPAPDSVIGELCEIR
ncbi:MAG TPA: haloacid dehalogenase type II [Casimicrobiaceae bacterium]|nr:haloacid dehalogenase type II [Casimicrobiaceae bacterium]